LGIFYFPDFLPLGPDYTDGHAIGFGKAGGVVAQLRIEQCLLKLKISCYSIHIRVGATA
jgi:hypothetical protein